MCCVRVEEIEPSGRASPCKTLLSSPLFSGFSSHFLFPPGSLFSIAYFSLELLVVWVSSGKNYQFKCDFNHLCKQPGFCKFQSKYTRGAIVLPDRAPNNRRKIQFREDLILTEILPSEVDVIERILTQQ